MLPGEDPDKIRHRNAQAPSSQSINSLAEYWYEILYLLFYLLIYSNIGL